MRVGILYVCTGKYIRFWDEFYQSCEEHFMPGVEKHYYVFTDQAFAEETLDNVTKVHQENLGWPDNTLRRFHMFQKVDDALASNDYLYFFNANCRFKRPIGAEFLPEREDQLVVVRHPGQVNKPADQVPYERNPRSRACIRLGQGDYYVCGGVNGGSSVAFLAFAKAARAAIDADFRDGIVAQWHDESHLNRYILDHPHTVRHEGYCYPQNWKLNAEPIIEVRDKQAHGGRDPLRALGTTGKQEDMVTVAIFGGLGNQMFQYAMGRAMALRNGCRLQLDTRHYDQKGAFRYGLGDFNIKAVIGTSRTLPPTKQRRLKYLAWRHFSSRHRLIREQGLSFNEPVTLATGSMYLKGYWQSERYFSEFADAIREELTVSDPASGENLEMLRRIESEPCISVHVRRGDYVTNPKANAFHGTCSIAYYQQAVKQVHQKVGDRLPVYLFSDDLEWATENLTFDCRVIPVGINPATAAREDLRLMSSCTHNVIANSSFSWWAAWLNRSPDKMVIAPPHWFAKGRDENRDIIPGGWSRMDQALELRVTAVA